MMWLGLDSFGGKNMSTGAYRMPDLVMLLVAHFCVRGRPFSVRRFRSGADEAIALRTLDLKEFGETVHVELLARCLCPW